MRSSSSLCQWRSLARNPVPAMSLGGQSTPFLTPITDAFRDHRTQMASAEAHLDPECISDNSGEVVRRLKSRLACRQHLRPPSLGYKQAKVRPSVRRSRAIAFEGPAASTRTFARRCCGIYVAGISRLASTSTSVSTTSSSTTSPTRIGAWISTFRMSASRSKMRAFGIGAEV